MSIENMAAICPDILGVPVAQMAEVVKYIDAQGCDGEEM